MKRALSILLAICMVIAFLPATAAAVENPITYTYNFRSAATGGVGLGVPTIDSYDKTTSSGKWMYYAMSSDLAELYATSTSRFDTQSYGIRVQPSAKAMYAQLKLSIAELATYIPTLTYYNNGSASIDIEVFLAPASASDCFASEYKLGNYTHRSVSTSQEDTISFSPVTTSETEYILSFRVGSHVGNISLAQFELKETEAPKVTYTYNFGQANDVGGLVVVPNVTEYVAKGGSNGEWKYYGMCDGLSVLQEANNRTFEINQSYGAFVSISFNAVGQYAQFMLKIPKKNAYFEPELTLHAGAYSTKAKVYIAPKSAKNPRAKEYLRGYLSAKDMTCELSGFMTDTNETEYILTFENVSTGNGNDIRFKSLVLSEKDATEAQPVNEEYAFNFVHATAGIGIPTLDTYEKTLRNWKYCNMESALKATYDAGGTAARTLAGCLNIVPGNANGQWLSLTLDNISKGTYDITFDYATHKNGGIGDIYLAPATVAESSRTNAEYKIGTIDYYEADAAYKTGYSAKLLKTTLKEDGDYVITFKHTGKKDPKAAGYQMNPSKLRLYETEPDAPSGTAANELASLSVLAENGGTISVDGSYSVIDKVAIGTKITATATANDGYVFAYWRNAAGAWLSSDATQTFTVNTNTAVIAVFDKLSSDNNTEIPVYFYNENGSLIESKKVEKEKTFGEVKISTPTLTGFTFDKWSIADDALITKLTRAVALYNESDARYSVNIGSATVASDKKYGETVTVTSGNNNFSYWMLGDDIITYDKSFTFRVYGDITLTEVCEGAKNAEPAVALDAIGESYFLGYTVPAGYQKIEAGILFSKDGKPTIGSFYSKASEKTGSGQFTAKSSGDGETIARGYLIFKAPDGKIRVVYTD